MMNFSKEEKSWMLYDLANSAYSLIIITALLPIYFKIVAQTGNLDNTTATAYWGYMTGFSTLLVSLAAPFLGSLGDYMGKKKHFFRFFLFLGSFFTIGLALVPSNQWGWLLVIYTLSKIGYQAANLFYDAFLTDVTTNQRSDIISSYGFAIGYIGSALLFLFVILLTLTSGFGFLSTINVMRLSFILTAIWWFVFSLPMLKNVHQKYGLTNESVSFKKSTLRLIKTLRDIGQYKTVVSFMLAYFFYSDGVDTIITMSTTFGVDMGVKSTTLVLILLVVNVIAFPSTILYARLAKLIGTKRTLLVAIGVYIVICFYAMFMRNIIDFWLLGILVGTSQGGIQALSRAYFSRIIPKDKANEFFGFYNILGKFSAVFGPILFSLTTQLTGRSQFGLASLIILFLIGGLLVTQLKEQSSEEPTQPTVESDD